MVDQNAPESDLKKLFYSRPRVFADYMLNAGRLAVILLDAAGTILDCNAFFLENAGLAEKPVGRSINAFLRDGQVAAKACRAGDCLPVKLTFDLNTSLERSLSGHLLEIDGRYVIFAHTVRLTDNELVATLSRLTDELTDLTRELNKKNRELAAANETITRLMMTDPLTGLANRRQLSEMMDRELSLARRSGRPLAALMADIDHFKSINDTYGHDMGDKVLKQVAQILRDTCRKEDIVARYGGEEFLVILPDSGAGAAADCAERMRKAVAGASFTGIDRPVTASFGATVLTPADTEDDFLKRADAALYEAKAGGRNRVVVKKAAVAVPEKTEKEVEKQ